MEVKDISYEYIEADGRCMTIMFNYKIDGINKTSYLQLPDCADSEHQIDDGEGDYDSNDEEHAAIFESCRDFYYNDFDDVDLAAASALLGHRVVALKEGEGRTLLAVDECGEEVELVESIYADYFGLTIFDFPDSH